MQVLRQTRLLSQVHQRPVIAKRNNGSMKIVNPANGELVQEVAVDTASSVATKVANAKKAQLQWKTTPIQQRMAIVAKFGELLDKSMNDAAKTLSSEMGKPVNQAMGEIKGLQARLKFYLENVEKAVAKRETRKTAGFEEIVSQEPLGVVGNISAWNYPYFVSCNVFLPALMTGNAVIYKPSEYATLTGLHIDKLLHEAGVPKDVFATIVGKGDVGKMLLEQDINGLFFTGSLNTGKKIAKELGDKMIKVQLELGGKDPTYVCEDANVEAAAKSLADGAMYNTGQSCCSVERIYVNEKVFDQFLKIFVDEVKTFKVGDPLSTSTYIGPLTLPHQPAFLEQQVKDAVSKGAVLHVGGSRINQKGNWFQPTVLSNVNHTMAVMKDESFGPIIGIQKVKTDAEAVQLMNDTEYGLTSGVYTPNKERALSILSQVNSGTVYWNACDRVSPYCPWTGRKGSGIGSTLGMEGIYAFVQPKSWHLVNPN